MRRAIGGGEESKDEGPWRDSGSCLKREMAGELRCDWVSPSADTRALQDRLKGLDPGGKQGTNSHGKAKMELFPTRQGNIAIL